jgi:hypothetical protein
MKDFVTKHLDPTKIVASDILWAVLGFHEGYDSLSEQLKEANEIIKYFTAADMDGICTCPACLYLKKYELKS